MFVYVLGVFLESVVAFCCVSKNLAVYRFCSKTRMKKERSDLGLTGSRRGEGRFVACWCLARVEIPGSCVFVGSKSDFVCFV